MNPFTYEEWKFITDKSVPGVVPNMYEISNLGRVRSYGKRKMFIKPVMTTNGYYRVNLRHTDGSPRYHLLHRILMIEFCPNDYYQKMQVNHIDGDKSYNTINNLEWCTPAYNIQHAFNLGLKQHNPPPQYVDDTIITEDQADQIGNLLYSTTLHFRDIARIVKCPTYVVSSIAKGQSWMDVYNKYNLSIIMPYRQEQHNMSTYFTDQQIHLICKYFQDNKSKYIVITDLYRAALIDLFGIMYEPYMNGYLSNLYHKRTKFYIVNQYDY